jgi:NAD(P)H-dependent nitrite reductase small subunit
MATLQEQYDQAMFDFSSADYDSAIVRLKLVLAEDPGYFDAQLSLGMAYYRRGDYASAITEGHKAEQLQPKDQLVHTNLSLFYMKAGDKKTAEHHGLQARIASWKENMAPPGASPVGDAELQMAQPKPPPVRPPEKFPDMPWKKKPAQSSGGSRAGVPPATPGVSPAITAPEETAIEASRARRPLEAGVSLADPSAPPATIQPEEVAIEASRARRPLEAGETPAPLPSDPGEKVMGEFVSVADVASLPAGHGRTVHVHGREFAVFNLDGEYFAIDNVCPHKGGPLGAGLLKDGRLFCPLHGWEFEIKTGQCITRPDRPVTCYPTQVREGQVQICI